jgi:hypothetical protein
MIKYESIKDNTISGDPIKDGDYKMTFTKSKHYASLKQYWCMLDFSIKNFPEWVEVKDAKALHNVLKLKCGITDKMKIRGTIIEVPASASLDSIDAIKLQKFKNDALDEIFEMFGLGMTDFVASILTKFVHTKGVSNDR